MSFSGEVKRELAHQCSDARHCQIAEITAIITMCGGVAISAGDRFRLKIQTENSHVARKCFTLLKKAFNIEMYVRISQSKKPNRSPIFCIYVLCHEDSLRVLKAAKLIHNEWEVGEEMNLVNNMVVQKVCCRRSFLRGAFLANGSISDPEKGYHFEIVCATMEKAVQLQEILFSFQLEAKIVCRKNHYVVYIKEGDQIADLLKVMEAPVSVMKLENIRILKEVRNDVNRKVNCEAANINKTVSAAVKQIEDIRYIESAISFRKLSDKLAQVAMLRLENPDASLTELGQMLQPPVGKSGVNHRLRKLSEIAEQERQNKEDLKYD